MPSTKSNARNAMTAATATAQSQLCLDCHKEIAADSRRPQASTAACTASPARSAAPVTPSITGRDDDIVKLSREQFNHEQRTSRCGAPTSTAACDGLPCGAASHTRSRPSNASRATRKEEPHEGKLGRDCAAVTMHARVARRSSSTTTRPLSRCTTSTPVPCVACHFGNRYKDTPRDVSRAMRPMMFTVANAARSAPTATRPRAGRTRNSITRRRPASRLEGVHDHLAAMTATASRQPQGQAAARLLRLSSGLRTRTPAASDRDCDNCHGNEKWKPADLRPYARHTWPLTGRTTKVACHACHTASTAPQKLPHRLRRAATGRVTFTRASSAAPAINATRRRAGAPSVELRPRPDEVPAAWACTSRSRASNATSPASTATSAIECIDCHRRDDVHKGGLGKECAKCHSPNGWRLWEFDHGKETGFALTGAHGKLACAGLPQQPAEQVKLKRDCLSCHEQDDVHLGQYGRQCDRCHSHRHLQGRAAALGSAPCNPRSRARACRRWAAARRTAARPRLLALRKPPVPRQARHVRSPHDRFRAASGQHRDLPCESCHANAIFKGTPRSARPVTASARAIRATAKIRRTIFSRPTVRRLSHARSRGSRRSISITLRRVAAAPPATTTFRRRVRAPSTSIRISNAMPAIRPSVGPGPYSPTRASPTAAPVATTECRRPACRATTFRRRRSVRGLPFADELHDVCRGEDESRRGVIDPLLDLP